MTTQQRRSELVRERRKQRRGPGQASKSRGNTARRDMPPMVSRSGMVVTPSVEVKRQGKKQLKNRRRYDVAIGSTGAEIRFPSVAIPKVGWRVVSFLMLVVLAVAFYWLWTAPQFKVTADRVVVNGIKRVDKETLLEKAGILNRSVFLVDPGKLSDHLPGDMAALESIQISIGMNGKVVIDAVERVPVIAWDQESISQVSWVDVNGKIFPAIGTSQGLVNIKANAAPPSPASQVAVEQADLKADVNNQANPTEGEVATAEQQAAAQLLESELVNRILDLAKDLPEGSQLIYDGEHGFGWQDPEFGWMVYFGKELDQTDLRTSIYAAIMNMFMNKERKPILISVEYLYAPYYRMEP
jgi:cell division septal protein FtsQ